MFSLLALCGEQSSICPSLRPTPSPSFQCFPCFSLNMYQLDKQRFEQAYKGRFVIISSNIHCIRIGTLYHRIMQCMQFYQCTDSLSVANHFGVTKSPQTKVKSIEDCQTELLGPSLAHSVHNEEDQIVSFDKLIT